jgi:glutamate 5-kinase
VVAVTRHDPLEDIALDRDSILIGDDLSTSVMAQAQRLVVKVGSSLVTNEGRGIDAQAIATWAAEIAALRDLGREIVVVSSGAVAEGMKRLSWVRRPQSMQDLQAAAAVGQMGLAQVYETEFRRFGLQTAQILLTHEDLADRTRYLNARSTLTRLIELGVIPIINENDTVVTDEIKVGDNDTLAALVTNLIEADALVILTDQAGLYTADPRSHPDARLLSKVKAGDPRLEAMAGGAGSLIGKGGMLTKVLAARRAASAGAHTIVASGRESKVLQRLAGGEMIGTSFIANTAKLTARKQWIADQLQLRGALVLDAGALKALLRDGKSLLPIGVSEVQGDFARGDVVACLSQAGSEVGRGLINYASSETRRIIGKPSSEIESLLGFVEEPELIHRSNLVITHLDDSSD